MKTREQHIAQATKDKVFYLFDERFTPQSMLFTFNEKVYQLPQIVHGEIRERAFEYIPFPFSKSTQKSALADPYTLRIITRDGYVLADKNQVYLLQPTGKKIKVQNYFGKKYDLNEQLYQIVADVSGKHFKRVLKSDDYYKNKVHVFRYTELQHQYDKNGNILKTHHAKLEQVPKADPNSFQVIDVGFAKDCSHLYCGKELLDLNVETYEMEHPFIYDDTRFYYLDTLLEINPGNHKVFACGYLAIVFDSQNSYVTDHGKVSKLDLDVPSLEVKKVTPNKIVLSDKTGTYEYLKNTEKLSKLNAT